MVVSLHNLEWTALLTCLDEAQSGQVQGESPESEVAIALLYLYLFQRYDANETYLQRASSRLQSKSTSSRDQVAMSPRRLSPLNNTDLQLTFLRLAAELHSKSQTAEEQAKATVVRLKEAVGYALKQPDSAPINKDKPEPTTGLDEVLQGRAGLLWAILIIRSIAETQDKLALIDSLVQSIRPLIDRITASGVRGSEQFNTSTESADGFMWPWINKFYGFGAMHGTTGILSVLLSCEDQDIHNHFDRIAKSIDHLCGVCITAGGYLPMSAPPFPSKASRSRPLVQLCHGSPGLLLLLACARRNGSFARKHWKEEWDKALELASHKIWSEGLLSKGLSVCHGIAGNALPWVLLSTSKSPADSAERERQEYWLSLAIPFLIEAKNAPPMGNDERFRMPDNPFSLPEGSVGAIIVVGELIKAIKGLFEAKRGEAW